MNLASPSRTSPRTGRHLLGSGPANRRILAVAWPVVLSTLSQTLLVTVDFVMVGLVSTDALAGVGQAGTFMSLFLSVSGSLGFGLSTAVAMALGAGRRADAGRLASQGLAFGLLLGAGLAMGCAALLGPGFTVMGLDPPVLAASLAYGYPFCWGLVLAAPAAMASAVLCAHARTGPVLVASLVSVVVNLAGDWLLIFGNLGAPALGVAGAAWASVAATAASLVYLLGALMRRRAELLLVSPWGLAGFGATVSAVVRLGITTTLDWLAWVTGIYALAWMLAPFGATHLAVFHTQIKVQAFFILACHGLSVANNTLIGRAHGAVQPRRIGLWHGHCLRLGLLSLIPAISLLVWPEAVFGVFNLSPAELAVVAPPRLIGAVTLVMVAMSVVNNLTGSSLRSVGVVRFYLVTLSVAVPVVVLSGFTMTRALEWGALGAMLATTLDEMWRAAANTWRFRRVVAISAPSPPHPDRSRGARLRKWVHLNR